MLNVIKTKFKNITNGISVLYKEAKYVYKLDKTSLNRRNSNLVVEHYNDLKKVGAFVVVQAVPIIGWFPIIFAMIYPKQILTKHFWSNEEYDSFIKEDHKDRLQYGQDLNKYITNNNINIEKTQLSTLPYEHSKLLAGANQIFTNQIFQKLAPNIACQTFLKTRALEIRKDDELLNSEGINDLTLRELQIANSRRGLDPSKDHDTLKSQLQSWLLKNIEGKNDTILLHSSATQ